MPRQKRYYLTQSQPIINDALGFTADSIRIDNYTSAYMHERSTDQYIAPKTYRAVIPYRTDLVLLEFAAPPGTAQPAFANATEQAEIIYEAQDRPAQAASSLPKPGGIIGAIAGLAGAAGIGGPPGPAGPQGPAGPPGNDGSSSSGGATANPRHLLSDLCGAAALPAGVVIQGLDGGPITTGNVTYNAVRNSRLVAGPIEYRFDVASGYGIVGMVAVWQNDGSYGAPAANMGLEIRRTASGMRLGLMLLQGDANQVYYDGNGGVIGAAGNIDYVNHIHICQMGVTDVGRIHAMMDQRSDLRGEWQSSTALAQGDGVSFIFRVEGNRQVNLFGLDIYKGYDYFGGG